jgi:hypothetical protein
MQPQSDYDDDGEEKGVDKPPLKEDGVDEVSPSEEIGAPETGSPLGLSSLELPEACGESFHMVITEGDEGSKAIQDPRDLSEQVPGATDIDSHIGQARTPDVPPQEGLSPIVQHYDISGSSDLQSSPRQIISRVLDMVTSKKPSSSLPDSSSASATDITTSESVEPAADASKASIPCTENREASPDPADASCSPAEPHHSSDELPTSANKSLLAKARESLLRSSARKNSAPAESSPSGTPPAAGTPLEKPAPAPIPVDIQGTPSGTTPEAVILPEAAVPAMMALDTEAVENNIAGEEAISKQETLMSHARFMSCMDLSAVGEAAEEESRPAVPASHDSTKLQSNDPEHQASSPSSDFSSPQAASDTRQELHDATTSQPEVAAQDESPLEFDAAPSLEFDVPEESKEASPKSQKPSKGRKGRPLPKSDQGNQ